jgi:hypothetical protein
MHSQIGLYNIMSHVVGFGVFRANLQQEEVINGQHYRDYEVHMA